MADDTSFLQEIDESMRVEKLQLFWQRSGNLVIAGCIGIVLVTIVSVWWKDHQREAHMRQTSILLSAETLSAAGKYNEAAQMLASAEHSSHGLATLARLLQAEALMKVGKNDKAREVYAQIAADNHDKDELAFRDFAAIQAAALADNQHTAPDFMKADEKGRPFTSMASEMEATRLIQAGKSKEATALLTLVADDVAAPPSERTRAMEMLSQISGGK